MNIRGALLSPLALWCACSIGLAAEIEDVAAPIVETATFDDRPMNWGALRHGREVLFAGEGDSPMGHDIVSVELSSGRKRVLARAISDARFMARDERFIVIAQREKASTRLILLSSSSGEQLANATLENDIEWAGILGDRLIIVQQDSRQGGTTAIAMNMPGLERLKAVAVSRIAGAAVWKDNVILLGRSLEYFDRDLQSQVIVDIPPTPPLRGHSCNDGPLRVEGDRAVAVRGCGYIHVFDLEGRRHQFVIPRYADSYGLDVAQGLIFTTPAYWHMYGRGGRVFDLHTGRELATFPFAGEALFASDVGLAALTTEYSQRPQFTLYRYDAAALRDGRWQIAHAAAECAAAGELAANGDFSAAADRCEAAGIGSVPREAWRRPPLAPYARQYAHWLSLALDRGTEALAALDAVRGPERDDELAGWREEARLKQILLDRGSKLPVTAAPRRGSFSAVFSRGSQYYTSTPIPMRFGMYPNVLHFDGDRVYLARWGCDGSSTRCIDDKHYLDVLDQSTFQLLRSVEIEGLEGDDNYVSSVAARGNLIFVTAEYRYGDGSRANVFAYDSEALERRASGLLPDVRRLAVREGKLLACACGTEGGQSCLNLNPETLESSEEPAWSCLGTGDHSQVVRAPVGAAALATPNYFVSPLPHHRRNNGFEFSVRDAATPAPPTPRLMTGTLRSMLFPVPEADRVVTLRSSEDRVRLGLFDIPSGRFSTLENLVDNYTHVSIVADPRRVYVGRGRDLLVYNQSTLRLERYVRDFIPNDGNPDGILRMLIAGHRLVVLTNAGKSSRTLDLRQFDAEPAAAHR
jgi:hypothetical protein